MTTALLLIDIQNDYFPGGAMEVIGAGAATTQAARLLAAYRQKSLPVIHIQHLAARPGATFFLPGTSGAEIHESVRPASDEPVFQKHFPNSFRETPLLEHLRDAGISRLVIAGMMTHMCIDTTTRPPPTLVSAASWRTTLAPPEPCRSTASRCRPRVFRPLILLR